MTGRNLKRLIQAALLASSGFVFAVLFHGGDGDAATPQEDSAHIAPATASIHQHDQKQSRAPVQNTMATELGKVRAALKDSQLDVATLAAAVSNLSGELNALRLEFRNRKLPAKGTANTASHASGPARSLVNYSVAERFEAASDNPGNWEGSNSASSAVEEAFYSDKVAGLGLNYSNCKDNICRISYTEDNSGKTSLTRGSNLTTAIAESFDSDVNIFRTIEGDEHVVYVERVEVAR